MKTLVTACLCLLPLLPAAAGAGVALTLGFGIREGTASYSTEDETALIVCVTTPCALAEVETAEGELGYSLILDVPISRRWMVEVLLTEQDGDLELTSSIVPDILDRGTFESTTLQIGLLRQWGDGRLRPFATGAVGGTRFESTVPAYDRPFFPGIVPRPVDEEVLSGSLAAGLEAGLGRRIALRLEGRTYWHDLPERLGGTWQQNEAGIGLAYRF